MFVGDDGVLVTYLADDVLSEMRRARDETADRTFLRLEKSLSRKGSKKTKAKAVTSGGTMDPNVAAENRGIRIEYNNDVIETSVLLTIELKTGMVVTLSNGRRFFIVVEPPKVTDIVVYPRQMSLVGYPIIATGYSQLEDVDIEYLWYIEASHNTWVLRGNGRVYTPSEADIGKQIKVYCTPKYVTNAETKVGRSAVHYLTGKVKTASPISPVSKILQTRQDFIQRQFRDAGQLRVVTFNVLADQYASTARAVNCLFSYCPPEYLNIDYRCQLVLEEILAYDADVVCLQECDAKLFHSYYSPMLACCGYQGCYTNKSSSVNEGCATFINNKRLSLLRVIDVPIKKILRGAPYMHGIYSLRPDLRDVLGDKIGGIGQICVCRNDSGRALLFANTHLFYHPLAAFIRLLQLDVLVRALSSLKSEIESRGLTALVNRAWCMPGLEPCDMYQGANEAINNQEILPALNNCDGGVVVVVSGDLNSVASSSAIEYLLRGTISSTHDVWLTINDFRWGIDDEGSAMNNSDVAEASNDCNVIDATQLGEAAAKGSALTPALTNSLGLQSAAGFPQYTNFTGDFKDLLDYIFVPTAVQAVEVAPFPTLEEFSENVALPSMRFPSDHVSVAVDIAIE